MFELTPFSFPVIYSYPSCLLKGGIMENTFGTVTPSSVTRIELPDQENDRAGEYFSENKTKNCDFEFRMRFS